MQNPIPIVKPIRYLPKKNLISILKMNTSTKTRYYTSDKGEGQNFNNMPPYYVLIYIMKVY